MASFAMEKSGFDGLVDLGVVPEGGGTIFLAHVGVEHIHTEELEDKAVDGAEDQIAAPVGQDPVEVLFAVKKLLNGGLFLAEMVQMAQVLLQFGQDRLGQLLVPYDEFQDVQFHFFPELHHILESRPQDQQGEDQGVEVLGGDGGAHIGAVPGADIHHAQGLKNLHGRAQGAAADAQVGAQFRLRREFVPRFDEVCHQLVLELVYHIVHG